MAQDTSPVSTGVVQDSTPFQQILVANTLTDKGKIPFHLKVKFQVFGFDGKPLEEGSGGVVVD